jgi:hypothetical protein
LLFGSIAYRQNDLLENQNDLLISQNLRPTYDTRVRDVFRMLDSIDYNNQVMFLNKGTFLLDSLQYLCQEITNSSDYIEDSAKMDNNINYGNLTNEITFEYLMQRSYYENLENLRIFLDQPVDLLWEIHDLVLEIKRSNLHTSDKVFYLAETERKILPIMYLKGLLKSTRVKIPFQFSSDFKRGKGRKRFVEFEFNKINQKGPLAFRTAMGSDLYFTLNIIYNELDLWNKSISNDPIYGRPIIR